MELKQALEKLTGSKEFKDLNIKNNDIYFSYGFIMLENSKIGPWHIGYYHVSTDKMITFIVDKKEIKKEKEEEIFKKPGVEVKEVDIGKMKISYDKILKIAREFQKRKYPNEIVGKTLAIIQNLERYGNIWNITHITHSFNTLNMKINVENGTVISHNLESVMSFVKK